VTATGVETRAGRQLRATTAALFALLAVALLTAPSAGAQGATTRIPALALSWLAPTPADGKTYRVAAGTKLTVSLVAQGQSGTTQIWASGLAAGAVLTSRAGLPATAELNWTPTKAQLGTHVFVFVGGSQTGATATQPRSIFVQVIPQTPPATGEATPIGTNGVYRWAYVLERAAARARPTTSSRVVTHLNVFTGDSTVNLVLLLARATDANGRLWYRVRLPILPNNSTGWVLADELTTARSVSTYLVVYRKLFTATLYRNGRPIYKTRVGVGKPYWPTPTGDFYIREILTGYGDPFYGPVAFGTSARSAVLTDWEGGGGVIGIHGTNSPQILPGRVSHGCIRMKNDSVLSLLRLMPLGTPLAIR
jgi:hypothetical protein